MLGIEGPVEEQLVCLTAGLPLQPLERTQWSLKCTFGGEGEAYGIYKQKEDFRELNLKKLKAYPRFYREPLTGVGRPRTSGLSALFPLHRAV